MPKVADYIYFFPKKILNPYQVHINRISFSRVYPTLEDAIRGRDAVLKDELAGRLGEHH
jgi:hypothetical protein